MRRGALASHVERKPCIGRASLREIGQVYGKGCGIDVCEKVNAEGNPSTVEIGCKLAV